MSTEPELGPVDIVVIGYPPGSPRSGEAMPIMIDLVDRGIIRVLDVLGIDKAEDGSVTALVAEDIDGDGFPDLVAFAGAETGMIGDEDQQTIAGAMEPGSSAVVIVYENTWAAPFAAAVRRNGGQLLGFERVAAADLMEAIETLDA
jgi:hypothetical protein